MHIYFSGIGGAGIGPLALIAKQAGYDVSGSDAKDSKYLDELRQAGIRVHVGQSRDQITSLHAQRPIDWFVYSSALPKTDPDHPELRFCEENDIKTSKRDEFLNRLLQEKKLRLIAVAGTHGKTTTTAMAIWLMGQLNVPISYSVGAKLPSGDMGRYDPDSSLFIYEADEYDRNFLSFYPEVSLVTGLDWDHPDIFPTRQSYYAAFSEFIGQSAKTYLWLDDAAKLEQSASGNLAALDDKQPLIEKLQLPGRVNRLDAWMVANALAPVTGRPVRELAEALAGFPGVSRRFEKIINNLYTDYAHTPPKIRGALQLAHEVTGNNVVVVYEGLHNTRQHFIKDELAGLFDDVKELYVVPSYLAREDKDLELLTPDKLLNLLSNLAKSKSHAAQLDDALKSNIQSHLDQGDLVLCLSAGGSGSLDEWLRSEFQA